MYNPIIVTAPKIYNSSLVSALKQENFRCIDFPIIETLIFNNSIFDQIFKSINDFDYIILPSKTAIQSFINQLKKRNILIPSISATFIAIGKDQEELKKHGLSPILSPEEPSTKGIVDSLKKLNTNGKKFLLLSPKVEIIPEPSIIPELISGLKEIGNLTNIEAYITQPVGYIPNEIKEKILLNQYELIAISSGGEALALKYFFPDIYKNLKIACFGPYTAKTAVNEGFKPLITGNEFTSFSDFAKTIKDFLKTQK